jgi:hypothetical protein
VRGLRDSFAVRLLARAVLFGFLTRVITGVLFSVLPVADGWSGVVTFGVMYVVAFLTPARSKRGDASVIGVALGRWRSDGIAWPPRTRWACALAAVLAAVPIAVGVIGMPQSGRALDLASGVLVATLVFGVQFGIAASWVRRIGRRMAPRKG